MFAILKCCAWIQIVKQTCPRLKTSPQPVHQLSPNLCLMGKYEDLVESESGCWRPCNATHSTLHTGSVVTAIQQMSETNILGSGQNC